IAAVLTMVGSMPLMSQGGAHAHDLVARIMMPVDAVMRRLVPGLYLVGENWLKVAMLLVTIPVVAWSGKQFFQGARSGLRHRTADMNTLIALGAGAGFLYSALATIAPVIFFTAGLHPDVYFEAVNAIIALILLGRLLEARARGQMSEAIRALVALRPSTARVQRRGQDQDIPIEEV